MIGTMMKHDPPPGHFNPSHHDNRCAAPRAIVVPILVPIVVDPIVVPIVVPIIVPIIVDPPQKLASKSPQRHIISVESPGCPEAPLPFIRFFAGGTYPTRP